MTAPKLLLRPEWLEAPTIRRLIRVLTADGAAVRFVGGCVRDSIAGRPIHDLDLATPIHPEEVLRRLTAAAIPAIATGLSHGTVTAILDHRPFEITTLRRDLATDGRHAEVEFTDDWVADAARRDFTINALSLSPAGELFDPFGGLEDLAAGRVRFVGDPVARINEDVLRLLRFFRFYAHYGAGPADGEGLAACIALADRLPGLSGERVRNELLRLLDAPRAAEVWALMTRHGILGPVIPVATESRRLAHLIRLEAALGLAGPERRIVRLAALLPADAEAVRAIAHRLRLSNQERDRLVRLTVPPFPVALADDPARRRRALLTLRDGSTYRDLMLLAAAGAEPPVDPAGLAPAWAAAERWARVRFPLDGQDLLAEGIGAGPAIGQLLAALERWWVDQEYQPDRARCLEELRRRVSEPEPGK